MHGYRTHLSWPPFTEIGPENALRWLSEKSDDYLQVARDGFGCRFQEDRQVYDVFLGDVMALVGACVEAVTTKKSVELNFENDAFSEEDRLDFLARMVRHGHEVALNATGSFQNVYVELSKELSDRLTLQAEAAAKAGTDEGAA
jgi:hypothetical protein